MGVYGTFDPAKFDREYRPWFTGIEACNLRTYAEACSLAEYCRNNNIELGIHHPLVAGPAHALVTSRSGEVRQDAFRTIERALHEAKELGTAYMLIHYPKPSLLDPSLDWSDWRFPYPGEALAATQELLAQEEELGVEAFVKLQTLSQEVGMALVLEHDILHHIHYSGLLQQLYAAHPSIEICIDTGRLHMLEHTDPRFDGEQFIQAMTPYITNVHLWTVRLGTNKEGGHHPLLPRLDSSLGWGRMSTFLSALSRVPSARVMFEHRADLISPEELENCYQWVKSCLENGTENCCTT